MQLISCTHCRRTWEHTEEEKPEYLKTGNYFRERDERPGVDIRQHHDTPCFHRYTVETEASLTSDKVSAFKEVPYIPTLPDTLDIDFVSLLLKREVTSRNFISFYHDMLEESDEILEVRQSLGGDHDFVFETVHYKDQEVPHSSYFEREVPLHIFTVAELRVLAYLYQRNPIALQERMEAWYQYNSSTAKIDRVFTAAFDEPK